MYSSEQKLRSLILLDKSITIGHQSSEFVTYVQQKLIENTLKPLATHCPQGFDMHNVRDLDERGNNIFLEDEPDPVNAALFLALLLFCFKTWAQKFPCDENGQRTIFQDAFLELKGEGFCFPQMAP